jgi:hypothetical protein
MKKIILFLMISLLTSSITAQTRKQPTRKNPARNSAAPRKLVDTISLDEDGTEILLYDNMTYEIKQSVRPAEPVRPVQPVVSTSRLSFETGLVLKSGDVKPIARTTFYLLDKGVIEIMRDAGMQADSGLNLIDTLGMAYYGRAGEVRAQYYAKALEAIKPHIKAQTTTDFNGRGQFEPVPLGSYFMFGVGQVFKNIVVWDATVELKNPSMHVTLDQNNAASAF